MIAKALMSIALSATMISNATFASDESNKPAASVADLRLHFASCLRAPTTAAASRPTFYFSLTSSGAVVARPRIVLFGFEGSSEARGRLLSKFSEAFSKCVPLKVTPAMASSLPGEVYFLQYVVGLKGEIQETVFRPFGSHGGGYTPLPLQPKDDGFIPPGPSSNLGLDALPPPQSTYRQPHVRAPFLLLRQRARQDHRRDHQ